MNGKPVHLDKTTTIPLWVVISAIPALIGGISWITYIAEMAKASRVDIQEIKISKSKDHELLIEIREKVSFIEGQIRQKEYSVLFPKGLEEPKVSKNRCELKDEV